MIGQVIISDFADHIPPDMTKIITELMKKADSKSWYNDEMCLNFDDLKQVFKIIIFVGGPKKNE